MSTIVKKIITVFGATGGQGGGVASTFLSHPALTPEWTVRAVTRDPSKPAAAALASRGAQVVAADMNDQASLVAAMRGSSVVFAVTDYWATMSAATEVSQGKALADAAAEVSTAAGSGSGSGSSSPELLLYIFSSLPNVKEATEGKLSRVYHFDSKAEVEAYTRSKTGLRSAFMMPGFYITNLTGPMGFRKEGGEDGNKWVFGLPVGPQAQVPLFNTADAGLYVKAMVRNQDRILGKQFLAASEYVTAGGVVETFKKVFSSSSKVEEASYVEVPEEGFRAGMQGSGMPGFIVDELFENMKLLEVGGYYGGRGLEETLELVEGVEGDKLTTWEEFARNSEAFKGLL